MSFFIVFVPALGWGIMPIIAQLTKASPKEQLTGTTLAALFFATVWYAIHPSSLVIFPFLISFISGILWSIGQYLQFQAFQKIGVPKAIPVICGLQLIGTTLFAAMMFNEWQTRTEMIVGSLALLFILLGLILTSYQQKQHGSSNGIPLNLLFILICSALALTCYALINQLFDIPGNEVILPQALGMFSSSLLINAFSKAKPRPAKVYLNVITGGCWSVANLAFFIANGTVGTATSFPISQGSIIIATLGSIFIFKEAKKRLEWLSVVSGIVSVAIGVIMISLIKTT
ncbi:GRP family sugar transporter [Paenibacillus ehimensis]|uniref:GRP family sugar transporter n=1 Tax=Paenibacillus ehimensis TaxID=79264 RepID=UPI0004726EE5|nr:GRP family sugar transporter [Paenibacillus ehimensis]